MDIVKEIKTLFENKWVSIKEKVFDRDGHEGRYVYTSKPWCNSTAVAILPYRAKHGEMSILGRFEICPAHSNEIELCSITGGYDNSNKFSLEQCILNELLEEGGYIGREEDLEYLGFVRPSKSSDTTMHLYAIDLDKCERGIATTDGTIGEIGAYCQLVSVEEGIMCKDPLISTMILRLIK